MVVVSVLVCSEVSLLHAGNVKTSNIGIIVFIVFILLLLPLLLLNNIANFTSIRTLPSRGKYSTAVTVSLTNTNLEKTPGHAHRFNDKVVTGSFFHFSITHLFFCIITSAGY